MGIWLISFICLFLGYKLFAKQTERQYGVNIHRKTFTNKDAEYAPLASHQLQLAQLGLMFGAESFLGIVVGLMYGPLMMIWCVLGTTFFGAGMTYYCGMHMLSTGKTINSVILKFFGKQVYYLLTFGLIIFICFDICVNFVFIFNLNYEVFGTSLWVIAVVAVIAVAFLSPRAFIKIGILTAVALLITTVYFLLFSLKEINNLEPGFKPWSFREIKFAYPLLFFTLSAGAVSGIQALKASLVAPYIKNEKMGRNIFWRVPFIQSGIIILWNLLILSWNPSREFIISVVYNGANVYSVLSHNMADHIWGGSFLLYITTIFIIITSIVSLLRVGTDIILETKDYPPATMFYLEGAMLLLCCIIYPLTFGNSISSMNSLIMTVYVLLLVSFYLKLKNGKAKKYFIMAIFLLGVMVSEFILQIHKISLYRSIMIGVLTSLVLYLLVYYKDTGNMIKRGYRLRKYHKTIKQRRIAALKAKEETKDIKTIAVVEDKDVNILKKPSTQEIVNVATNTDKKQTSVAKKPRKKRSKANVKKTQDN